MPREEAVRWLSIALEAVVENYAEYIDYNSTTTQSDRGDMLYTLLDYLRLRASYDRVAWNLLPVVLAHEVLVRGGHDEAADVWRAAVGERTASIADDHLKRFAAAEPQIRHAAAQHRRPAGRTFRAAAVGRSPLRLDRAGHGRSAAAQAFLLLPERGRSEGQSPHASGKGAGGEGSFARLEAGIEEFTREVSGAGFDVPPGWKPWSRRSIACCPTARRKRSCPIRSCRSRRCSSAAKKCGGRCRRWANGRIKGIANCKLDRI